MGVKGPGEVHGSTTRTTVKSRSNGTGASLSGSPVLWAGLECSVTRIGDSWFDQLAATGHASKEQGVRAFDIDAVAQLGARALRYPILWEHVAPLHPDVCDWSRSDTGVEQARAHGIDVIAGLVHHGSGPHYTNLLDPFFGEKLAAFAAKVASRYPWITHWTPVNEPLTTARFSGLYGHWFPHRSTDADFLRCLVNQCRGVVLVMRAVRKVNPGAKLVHTEDLGRTWSMPMLSYQADFENERRWLGHDLLRGRVKRGHALYRYVHAGGVTEEELAFFQEEPCTPDVFGINHYVTSDRFLDQRLVRYPAHTHGGNGRHRYADTEAVRVMAEEEDRFVRVARDMWERQGGPIVFTEVHLGCSREEQLRWFREAWNGAIAACAQGIPVQALTAWSVFGACDWDSLMTNPRGRYESGVFDVRGAEPRPTALAGLLRALAHAEDPALPFLYEEKGWWRRPLRLHAGAATSVVAGPGSGSGFLPSATPGSAKRRTHPLVITGATGTLGRAFARVCESRGLEYILMRRQDLDIASPESVQAVLRDLKPWAVVNAAGYVRVDAAENDAEVCLRENATGPATLASVCAELGVKLLTYSSDLVFDGTRQTPYHESHEVAPLSVYGRSKADAERLVLAALPEALIVRSSAFFGPWDEHNFVTQALRSLRSKAPVRVPHGIVVSPTYVPDLVGASLDLLIDGVSGVIHLANDGAVSWAEFARLTARLARVSSDSVEECAPHELGWLAQRPCYSVLASEAGVLLPSLEDALSRYLRDKVSA